MPGGAAGGNLLRCRSHKVRTTYKGPRLPMHLPKGCQLKQHKRRRRGKQATQVFLLLNQSGLSPQTPSPEPPTLFGFRLSVLQVPLFIPPATCAAFFPCPSHCHPSLLMPGCAFLSTTTIGAMSNLSCSDMDGASAGQCRRTTSWTNSNTVSLAGEQDSSDTISRQT